MKGYQLKITVQRIQSEVWRRVRVPGKITFQDLHLIIQKLFGWKNVSCYEFYMENSDLCLRGTPRGGIPLFTRGFCPERMLADDFLRKEKYLWYAYNLMESNVWEHLIEIEKPVEMEERWPQVLEFEGPDMLEDCSSEVDFELKKETAHPFAPERVNQWFRNNMKLPERKRQELFRAAASRSYWEENDRMENLMQRLFDWEEEDFKREMREIKEKGPSGELDKALSKRGKDGMCALAREWGIRGYSKLKKKELAVWLQERLLDRDTMGRAMKRSSSKELEIFEQAMEEGCVEAPLGRKRYYFLETYCEYDERGYLLVPENVRSVYRELRPSINQELEETWLVRDFCQGAVYLYGVISVKELKELWDHYQGKALSDRLLKEILGEYSNEKGAVFCDGTLLMDEWLVEPEDRESLEKEREKIERYLPETMEELLLYGREGKQKPNKVTESVVNFFEKKLQDPEEALELLNDIQERARVLGGGENFIEMVRNLQVDIPRGKAEFEWAEQVREAVENTRGWHTNGLTLAEWRAKNPSAETEEERKKRVFQLSGNKKIYPNDPCPCGSGKKYKHCCGRKGVR